MDANLESEQVIWKILFVTFRPHARTVRDQWTLPIRQLLILFKSIG